MAQPKRRHTLEGDKFREQPTVDLKKQDLERQQAAAEGERRNPKSYDRFGDGENNEVAADLLKLDPEFKDDEQYQESIGLQNAGYLEKNILNPVDEVLAQTEKLKDDQILEEIERQLAHTEKEIEYAGIEKNNVPELNEAINRFIGQRNFVELLRNDSDFREMIIERREKQSERKRQQQEELRRNLELERQEHESRLEEVQIDKAIAEDDLREIENQINHFDMNPFLNDEYGLARAEQHIAELQRQKFNITAKIEALKIREKQEQIELAEPGARDTIKMEYREQEKGNLQEIGERYLDKVEEQMELVHEPFDINVDGLQSKVKELQQLQADIRSEKYLNDVKVKNSFDSKLQHNYTTLSDRLTIFEIRVNNLLKAREEQLANAEQTQKIEEAGGIVIVSPEIDQELLKQVEQKIDLEEIKERAQGAKLLEGEVLGEFAFRQSIDEIERHNNELSNELNSQIDQANQLQKQLMDIEQSMADVDMFYDQKASFSVFKSLRALFDTAPAYLKKRELRKSAEKIKESLGDVQLKMQETSSKIATNKAAKTYLEMQLPNQIIEDQLKKTTGYIAEQRARREQVAAQNTSNEAQNQPNLRQAA